MKYLTSFVLILFTTTAFGQKAGIKLNLYSLTIKNISPRFEYALNDNMSLEASIGFLLPRGADIINNNFDFTSSDGKFSVDPDFKLRGFSITPSFRYYFGQKGPMQGFYLSPYLQYFNYTLGTTTTYTNDVLDLDFKLWGIGGGLGIGYQWVIGSGFTIDWYFIGGGGAYTKVLARYTPEAGTDLVQLKNDAVSEFESWIDNNFDTNEPTDIPEDLIFINNDRLEIGFPFSLPIGRIGLSLGFAF